MTYSINNLVLLATLLFANVGFGSDENVLPLASKSWANAKEVYLQTEMEIVTNRNDVKHDPSKRDYSRSRTELYRSGKDQWLGFVHLDNEDGSEMQNVYAENPEYGFALARRKNSNPWQVMSIVPRESGRIDWYEEASVAPWSILDIPLVDVLKDPTFNLISIADEVGGSGECKLVSFELKSEQEGSISKLRSCKLRICPANNYLVEAFDAVFESDGDGFRGIGQCTYEGTLSNVPRLQSYSYELVRSNKKTILWTSNITRLERCVKPKSDFTLSAYGLSEPIRATRANSLTWIVLAVVTLFAVSILFRRFSR